MKHFKHAEKAFNVYPWISHWTHQLLMFHIISFIVFSTCMYENKFQTPCLSTQHLSTKSILSVRCIIHHNHDQENNSDMIFLHTFVFPLIPIIFFSVLFVSIQRAMNNYTMQVTVTFLKLLFLPHTDHPKVYFTSLTGCLWSWLLWLHSWDSMQTSHFVEEQWNRSCACPGLPLMVYTGHYWWWCLIIWLRWCKLDFSVERVLFKPGMGYKMEISALGK